MKVRKIEKGRKCERECKTKVKGRKGEREKGRKGEREKGRKGEREKLKMI